MRSIHFDLPAGYRPTETQLRQRMRRLVEAELPPAQREVLIAYYFEKQSIPQIACRRGVHKTTVWRTLRRAERNLRRMMQY